MSYEGTERHPGYSPPVSSRDHPEPPPGIRDRVVRTFTDSGKDVRYALRSLAGSPGFTAVALLSLALGICIVTCAFSEMSGMALRTLPAVPHPEELVALQLPASYPNYQRYRAHDDLFTSTLAYIAPVPFGVSLSGQTRAPMGTARHALLLLHVGRPPRPGPLLRHRIAQPGAVTPMVVSYRFWQEHLASDPSAIGRTLRVNSQPVTIIGVGPKEFLGASPLLFAADLWMPLSVGERVAPELSGNALERRDRRIFHVVGRLRPGITTSRVEAELDAAAQQIEQENGDPAGTQKGRRVLLVEGGKLLPLSKQDLPFFTSFFTVMSGLILLIACANVGNMMLARAAGRRKEIAVRLALGAGRARIVRQLMTESMIVVAGAAVPAFLASMWLMRLLSGVRMPLLIPVAYDFQPDARVLLLTTLLTGVTGLVFGLVPALQATRSGLTPALKEGGTVRLPGRHRFNLRNLLMVGQFAGSLTLLVILGLLSFGIQTTLGIQAGFNPEESVPDFAGPCARRLLRSAGRGIPPEAAGSREAAALRHRGQPDGDRAGLHRSRALPGFRARRPGPRDAHRAAARGRQGLLRHHRHRRPDRPRLPPGRRGPARRPPSSSARNSRDSSGKRPIPWAARSRSATMRSSPPKSCPARTIIASESRPAVASSSPS